MKNLFIPKDVMAHLDSVFGRRAYMPHENPGSMEDIWKARGIAEVMDTIRQLYQTSHGEYYVPRCFNPTDSAAESEAASGAPAHGRASFSSG